MMTTLIDKPQKAAPASTPNPFVTSKLPRYADLYVIGAAVAAGAVMLVFGLSIIGCSLLAAGLYAAGISTSSLVVEGRRKAVDRLMRTLVTAAFVVAVIPLISTLTTVITKGHASLSWQFLTRVGGSVFDASSLSVTAVAGAWQAIVGTLLITGIAALISVPIGVLTAIYLVEYAAPRHWMARTVTFLVDVMTGIPSIVAGLFAFSLFTLLVGPKAFSGFSASIALSVLMIPIVVRSTEEMLRLVPDDLREASLALGVTRVATILRVVLPTAATGIITGVMLAVSRVVGETAPVFIAASFTDNFNANPFHGPMQTLPVMVYTAYKFPSTDIAASYQSAWGAALLLVLLVVAFNVAARAIAKFLSTRRLH